MQRRMNPARIDVKLLQAPFPYFGGKSAAASMVWRALGDVPNYIEPFAGSAAVLFRRPLAHFAAADTRIETINDANGFVCNVWRAMQHDPEQVARHADWPTFENDLHARHYWLLLRKDDLRARLEGDPDYFDAKAAGWWLWGVSNWIGSGFCEEKGPWSVVENRFVKASSSQGISRKRPHLGDSGQGVARQMPYLKETQKAERLTLWFQHLAARLENVRVCCGDWMRVLGFSVLTARIPCGVFLDPPYTHERRDKSVYGSYDNSTIAEQTRRWALEQGDDPHLRIVYAGYADTDAERDALFPGWTWQTWKPHGGYAHISANPDTEAKQNRGRETLWFSPHCLKATRQLSMFEDNKS